MIPSTNKAWLDLVTEETLEPDLPICDPHHHLWEFRTERVAQKYLMDEILADVGAGHNVVSTVFIECFAMYKTDGPEEFRVIGETEFVNGIAAMSASGLYGPCRVAAGIVGSVNLDIGVAAGDVLDTHIQGNFDETGGTAGGRGVIRSDRFDGASFREGFAQLAPRNLSFEAWCFHPQIRRVTDLARAFPDTTIILNHFGGPLGVGSFEGKADEVYAQWQKDIAELAGCSNVVAKLGGINMELNGFGWHEQDRPPTSDQLMEATRRYYEFTIEKFGVERCMFESNFPVDMVTCSYNVLWNSFKRLTAGYSDAEKRSLYHDTASRVYRLD
jgi:L-fuconolactonase